jgi:hypothetical protein
MGGLLDAVEMQFVLAIDHRLAESRSFARYAIGIPRDWDSLTQDAWLLVSMRGSGISAMQCCSA